MTGQFEEAHQQSVDELHAITESAISAHRQEVCSLGMPPARLAFPLRDWHAHCTRTRTKARYAFACCEHVAHSTSACRPTGLRSCPQPDPPVCILSVQLRGLESEYRQAAESARAVIGTAEESMAMDNDRDAPSAPASSTLRVGALLWSALRHARSRTV